MRIKTIIVLVLLIFLSVIIASNTQPVLLNIFGVNFRMAGTAIFTAVSLGGFALGFLAGRPRRSKFNHIGYQEETFDDAARNDKRNTLSDDDRDYLN